MTTDARISVLVLGSVVACGASLTQEAVADLVAVRYTGSITQITETDEFGGPNPISSFGSFDVGDGFTIVCVYDTSIPATSGDSVQGFFDDSLTLVTFELGGGGYSESATSGRIFQRNSSIDNFNLFNIPFGDHNGEGYGAAFPFDLVQLRDDQATIIGNALTILSPVPGVSEWEDRRMRLSFGAVPFPDQPGFFLDKFTITGTISEIANVAPNDTCPGALPISLGDTPYSTLNATSGSPDLPAECQEGGNSLVLGNDIFYTFLPAESGTLIVSTCGQADYDTRLAAYLGTCDTAQLIACNDDAPGCGGFTSHMEVPVTAGVPVILRVGGFGNNSAGTGTLTLTLESCPEDLDGNGQVDFNDLLRLLGKWGSCM